MQLRRIEGSQYAGLFTLLVSLLFVYPYLGAADPQRVLASLLLAAIPAAAVWSLLERGRALWIGVGLGVPATVAILQQAAGLDLVSPLVGRIFPLAFFAYATAAIIYHVITAPRIDRDVILGGICGYLMLGYTWGIAYSVMYMTDATAFTGSTTGGTLESDELMYFSFVTLTTLGYGDLTPANSAARSLAMLESTAGTLYLAVLISRLVGSYRSLEASARRGTDGD